MSSNVKDDKRLSTTTIDIILLVVMFAFFAMIFSESLFLSETAGLVPKLISGFAMILCVIQILVDIKKRKQELVTQPTEIAKPAQLRWYYLLAILIVYIACLFLLGFVPSVMLFLIITPYIMKQKRIALNIVIAIVATTVLYFAFVKIFRVQLPNGLIFDYLF